MDEAITVCRVGVLVLYGRGHYSLSNEGVSLYGRGHYSLSNGGVSLYGRDHYSLSSGGVSFIWTRPLQSVELGCYLCMDEAITLCRVGVLVVYGRVHCILSSGGVSCV